MKPHIPTRPSPLRSAWLAIGLLFAALPAQAVYWTHAAGSSLRFQSSYDGESFTGEFRRFQTRLQFDPASLSGHFDVRIDLSSVHTENDERDEVLLGVEFFNAAALGTARYTAHRFRRLEDGRFLAEGELTLRGHRHAVPLTFTWTTAGQPQLAGQAGVRRLAFAVGTGDWADTGLLPDLVSVDTRLLLVALPQEP